MISALMQPIISEHDVFIDQNIGALVHGKVEILDPVSNNFLNIYSYSEDEYIVATNPVILDIEGRPEQTYFCDRMCYLRVYAYHGEDEHGQPIYEFVRDFYAGHNAQSEISDKVIGIEGLRDVNPEYNTSVTVVGYHNQFDCEQRTYNWDPNSTLDVDNIWVVASDHSSTGRWILSFEGEYLPSTYAGVYPGKTSNINALCSYVSVINGKRTAPGIWFVPGTYSLDVNLQTEKRVLLDANTVFTCNKFYCGNLKVIGEPQDAICDFDFYDPEQEAHSSWFNTVTGFLNSGAKKYIIDKRDNFTNKTLSTSVTLSEKIIEGNDRLPITYYGSGKLGISKCVINGIRIFDITDILVFSYMDIHDDWWVGPQNIDFYNKVSAKSTSSNTLELDNFTSVLAYINAIGANGNSLLDLAGRSVTAFTLPSSVIELRNAHVSVKLTIDTQNNINIRDCYLDNAEITCGQLNIFNTRVHFLSEPTVTYGYFQNSEVLSDYDWSFNVPYEFVRCIVRNNFKRVANNTDAEAVLRFVNCNFENNVINSKALQMIDNTCEGCTIKIYPYKDGADYKMYCYLVGNTFDSGTPVEFTKIDQVTPGYYEDNVYDVQINWTITNNKFSGNNEGLRCRYYQHRTGSNYNKTFIRIDGYGLNTLVYSGNTGKCPLEKASDTGMYCNDYSNSSWYWLDLGNDQYISLWKETWGHGRVMPNLMANDLAPYYSTMESIGKNGIFVKYKLLMDTTKRGFIYPWSSINDQVNNGDLFDWAISVIGKVEAASPGDDSSMTFI